MEDVRTIPPGVRDKKKRFVTAVLNATPEGAIRYLRERGVVVSDKLANKLTAEMRDRAFAVAGLSTLAEVRAVQRSIERAAKKGLSFRQWKAQVAPKLLEKMEMRRKSRLEMIYRTNMNAAYNAGQWAAVRARVKDGERVILRYDAIRDSRTRPEHAALDGVALPAGHKFWKTHYPPNGYNCRCSVTAFSAATARELGILRTDNGKLPALIKDAKPHPDFLSAPGENSLGALSARLLERTRTIQEWKRYAPRLRPHIAELILSSFGADFKGKTTIPLGYPPKEIGGERKAYQTPISDLRVRRRLKKAGVSEENAGNYFVLSGFLEDGARWEKAGDKKIVAEKFNMRYEFALVQDWRWFLSGIAPVAGLSDEAALRNFIRDFELDEHRGNSKLRRFTPNIFPRPIAVFAGGHIPELPAKPGGYKIFIEKGALDFAAQRIKTDGFIADTRDFFTNPKNISIGALDDIKIVGDKLLYFARKTEDNSLLIFDTKKPEIAKSKNLGFSTRNK